MTRSHALDGCEMCSVHRTRRVMFETCDFVLVEDAYPLWKGHYLLVPKRHVLATAHLESGIEIHELIGHVISVYYGAMASVVAYEHGNTCEGDKEFRSIDHAHIHLLPLSKRLPMSTLDGIRFTRYHSLTDAYADLGQTEYHLLCLSPTEVFTTKSTLQSQFFRKTCATLEHIDNWNWKALATSDSEACSLSEPRYGSSENSHSI